MTQTLDSFRSSTSGWLRGTLAGWGTILLALAGASGVVLAGGNVIDVPAVAPIGLILLAALILGWKWIDNLSTTYELNADRLVLRKGIFVKSIDDIELYRVKDVRIDFSLINQMADIGTITLTSSDETTRAEPLVIPHVARARERREELRRLVDDARRKRGVREIDMVQEGPIV